VKAHVGEVAGDFERLRHLRVVGDAERDSAGAQEVEDWLNQPRFVTEFEGEAMPIGHHR
jgi:hypothetical protein